MSENWRELARTLRSAAQPTVMIELLDGSYQVPNLMRTVKADRDYAVLRELALGKQCVFDLGANLGATALVMSASMDESGTLTAFEASESACRNIQDVIRLNGLQNRVQVVNAVMAEASGLVLDFFWDHASGGASVLDGYLGHSISIRKATLALDDFVGQTMQRPDLIKIDVEGAERSVLCGMTKTLADCQPIVFLELHSWDKVTLVQNAAAILDELSLVKYQMVYLKTKEVVTDARLLANRGRCHVLLVPEAWPDWSLLDALHTSSL